MSRSAYAVFLAGAACAAFLALAGAAPAAPDAVAATRFGAAPHRVVQGAAVRVSVDVQPAGVLCSLSVRYRGGARQRGLRPVRASGGRATWGWDVPLRAATGRARLTASCRGAGRATHTMLVVGSVIPARITVQKKGFSVRQNPYSGSSVSYGVILANESPAEDALDVSVLVNFVMEDNRLIGSATSRVPAILAGSTYALGGGLDFPAGAPVARLEVVVQVGKRAARALRPVSVANIRVVRDVYDATWVGSVEAEVVNDHPALALQTGQLSAVVFDAAGNVIGGENGFSWVSLPPAARVFVKASSGFRAIPLARAASAQISVEGAFKPRS